MSNIFTFDIDKWIEQNTPWLLRQPKLLAFVKVCASPLSGIYNSFLKQRTINVLKATCTSQVFSLEKMLNDKWDSEERRITIDDGFATNRSYVFLKEENKPVYMNPSLYAFLPGEYADSGIDFIVNTHGAIALTAAVLSAIRVDMNYFKLASKRFKIV